MHKFLESIEVNPLMKKVILNAWFPLLFCFDNSNDDCNVYVFYHFLSHLKISTAKATDIYSKLKHENEIGKTAMLPHPPSFLS